MSAESFRIRLELLHLAREVLESQSRAKASKKANPSWENRVELVHGEDVISTEDILKEATKLEEFVSLPAPLRMLKPGQTSDTITLPDGRKVKVTARGHLVPA